jgi:hypothetical protein
VIPGPPGTNTVFHSVVVEKLQPGGPLTNSHVPATGDEVHPAGPEYRIPGWGSLNVVKELGWFPQLYIDTVRKSGFVTFERTNSIWI